jgi:hypothetical protein
MYKARHEQQILVRVTNEIGILADLSKVLADHGINMLAISGTGRGDRGEICLITDDNLRACDALTEHRYAPEQHSVIVLEAEHKPGLLRRITAKLASAGINIERVYATALTSQSWCFVVLHTSDDERALVLLHEDRPG